MIAYISLAAWVAVLIMLAPAAWRYVRGHYTLVGSYKLAVACFAAVRVADLVRLIFRPDVSDLRSGILVFSTMVAVYILILAWQDRRA
jgi:hypothetical protein